MSDLDIELQEQALARMWFHIQVMRLLQQYGYFLSKEKNYRLGIIPQRLMYVGMPFPIDVITSLN